MRFGWQKHVSTAVSANSGISQLEEYTVVWVKHMEIANEHPVAAAPPTGMTKKTFALLNAYHVLVDGLYDSVPVLLAFVVLGFGAGEKTVGSVVSAGLMASTVAGLWAVWFSRQLGPTGALALVTLGYGLGFVAASWSASMVLAGACFVLALAGHGVFHTLAFSWIAQETPKAGLGRALSDFTAIGDIGRIPLVSLAGFVAALPIAGMAGWRVVCFSYGLIALCAGGWLLWHSRRKYIAGRPAEHTAKGRVLPSLGLLKEKKLALALAANVLNTIGSDHIFTFMPLLLLGKGIAPQIMGAFALGFTVGCFAGKMLCGRLVDLWGARPVFVGAEVVQAGLLVLLVGQSTPGGIVATALALGMVTKGTVPVVQTILAGAVAPGQAYEEVFAGSSFVRGCVNMTLPLLFGALAANTSMELVYVLMAAAALVAVVPVLWPVAEAV